MIYFVLVGCKTLTQSIAGEFTVDTQKFHCSILPLHIHFADKLLTLKHQPKSLSAFAI